MWNGENFIHAEFTNDDRTHVRVHYHRPEDEGRGEFDFVYDEDHKYTQALLKLTDLDTMHLN